MPDNDFITQILARLGIDFGPAMRESKQFAETLKSVRTQLEALERAAGGAGRAAERTASDIGSARQRVTEHFLAREQVAFDKHYKELSAKQKVSAEQKLALESQYFARAEKNARQFFQRYSGQYNVFMDQIDRRFGWFLSSIAMFGAMNVFGQTIKAMGDVEMGMTQIARVTEDNTASFSLMRDELFKLGKEYGTSMATVQDIALRWAQAGYKVNDTLSLTRTSLLALNTAEMNAEQSTQSLIGIMSQWQLTAEDIPLVLDKINKTADDYAVTSQDLIDGLLRSSGAARVMNMTFDQLLGVLTATREASGRTGREVGNAVNSILSYMQRPKAIETFESFGIQVFADKARTQFRNVVDIMGDIASRWNDISESAKDAFVQSADDADLFNEELATALGLQNEWNDLQKRDIAQAAAGVYRRNYFIALLKSFAKVQEVVNNLVDAEGYSIRENERTMATYQKKVESLKVALTELAVAGGDGGLLGTMKGLVDGTKEAIDSFTQLPRDIQNAIILFVELTSAVAVANLALRMFTGAGFGVALKGIAAAMTGVEASSIGLGTALTILAKNPLTWIISAAGAAVVALNLYAKHQEQAMQETLDATLKAQDHANKVSELGKQYEELSSKMNLNNTEQERLNRLMQDIAEIFPQVVTQWDEQGRAIGINNDLLRENIVLAQEATKANARAGIAAAEKQLKGIEFERARLEAPAGILGGMYGVFDYSPAEVAEKMRNLATEEAKINATIDRFKAILGETPSGVPTPSPSPRRPAAGGGGTTGTGKTKLSDLTDPLKEAAMQAREALTPYNDILSLIDLQLTAVTTKERILDQAMKDKVPTVEQLAQKTDLYNQTIELNRQKQEQLHEAAEKGREQLKELAPQLEEVENKYQNGEISLHQYLAEMRALSPAAREIKREVNQYSDAWWDAQYNIDAATIALQRHFDTAQDYEKALKEEAKRLSDAYNARKEAIQEEIDANDALIKKKERLIEEIDDETKARVKNLQVQIDALDLAAKQDDRAEAEKKHNDKIKELQKERLYHEVRTGIEHLQKIAEIDKQIAEENHEWEQRKKEWARDDQKKSLQDQIKAIEDEAEERKKAIKKEIDDLKDASKKKMDELEKYYRKARNYISDQNLKMIADLAAKSPEWFDTGKELINALIEGMKSGDWDEVEEIWDKIGGKVKRGGEEEVEHSQYWPYREPINEIVWLKGEWKRGYEANNQTLMNWAENEAKKYYNQLPEKVANILHSLDYDRAMAWMRANVYHSGGPVISRYRNVPSVLESGEYVLSSKTVRDFGGFSAIDRIVAAISAPRLVTPSYPGDVSLLADRIVTALQRSPRIVQIDKMLNVENADYGDGMDFDIQSRSLVRATNALLTAKGA